MEKYHNIQFFSWRNVLNAGQVDYTLYLEMCVVRFAGLELDPV